MSTRVPQQHVLRGVVIEPNAGGSVVALGRWWSAVTHHASVATKAWALYER